MKTLARIFIVMIFLAYIAGCSSSLQTTVVASTAKRFAPPQVGVSQTIIHHFSGIDSHQEMDITSENDVTDYVVRGGEHASW